MACCSCYFVLLRSLKGAGAYGAGTVHACDKRVVLALGNLPTGYPIRQERQVEEQMLREKMRKCCIY